MILFSARKHTTIRPAHPLKALQIGLVALGMAGSSAAFELAIAPAAAQCGVLPAKQPAPPAAAQHRLPNSQVIAGNKDVAWVWFGSPTARYPHPAFGSPVHAGSLHVLTKKPAGGQEELILTLPAERVFEDRVPRLVDLDGDGRDEIVVVEADAASGASVVVFGVRALMPQAGTTALPTLVELARSPATGTAFRWLNPAGFADFDGDGRPDVAAVTTPHIGGVLTLYRYLPPQLQPYARATDVSNHRYGALEQQLAVVVERAGSRPTVLLPDMQHTGLQALRWDAPGQWTTLVESKPLPARVERLSEWPGGACARLADASWWQITLKP